MDNATATTTLTNEQAIERIHQLEAATLALTTELAAKNTQLASYVFALAENDFLGEAATDDRDAVKMIERLDSIGKNDKTKTQETLAHCLILGIKARENSIKATEKRKSADEAVLHLAEFNNWYKLNPAAEQPLVAAMLKAFHVIS